MFYGAAVKPGAAVKLSPEGGLVLHISSACLSSPTSDERTYLILHHEDKNHVLCCLKKDQAENVPLDIFVSTQSGAQLKVQGKSEVHVAGYYEPMDDGSDIPSDEEEEALALDDEDESTQVSSDEEKTTKHSKNKRIEELEDDDDQDDDEDGDDDEDANEDDDEDEDDSDSDDKNNAFDEKLRNQLQRQFAQESAKNKKNKKQAPVTPPAVMTQKNSDKKRKGGMDTLVSKPEKQQKTNAGGSSGPINDFEKAISAYLKKHGRSLISQIASACPKPAAVTSKYREFLVSRPTSFSVEGQYVVLKA